MRRLFIFLGSCFGLASCLNKAEIGHATDVEPESIYYDYKVRAEEGREDATIILQYRFGGEDGTTLVLQEPSKVSVDGIELKADSAKLTGAFYELVKPVTEFIGKHVIVFIDRDKIEHKEEFSFELFTLAEEFPEEVKKTPFTIKLSGIEPNAEVQLVITDTAFTSADVNEDVMLKNGEIRINPRQLDALQAGPVTLEIYYEKKMPLKNASKEGGRLLIATNLRRQFELVN